ncbi:nose resistant to fluoxetine protein 6-like [Pomacea canaliculata]|nr:nose resistant to fluoxetine protein 6-like [Pomacea canaliculata]
MFAALGWLVAAAAGLTCVYVMFDNVKNFYQTFQGAWNMDQYTAYETLSRPVWACAVAWVIFACCSGSGGFVNTFLSWSGWTPLSRLTYGVYLFHLITFFVLLANRITPFHASTWTMTDMTVSVTVLTFMVSFVFSLLVESPTLGLEKLLLGSSRGKKSH